MMPRQSASGTLTTICQRPFSELEFCSLASHVAFDVGEDGLELGFVAPRPTPPYLYQEDRRGPIADERIPTRS
jgi:hypothetical protein